MYAHSYMVADGFSERSFIFSTLLAGNACAFASEKLFVKCAENHTAPKSTSSAPWKYEVHDKTTHSYSHQHLSRCAKARSSVSRPVRAQSSWLTTRLVGSFLLLPMCRWF